MALSETPPSGYQCVYSYDTYAWQPAHTTTFVLPVYEIEQIVGKLNTVIDNMDSTLENAATTIAQLQNQTTNWQTVLTNYRNYNSDKTAMLSAETLQFNKMVKVFLSSPVP